MKGIKPSKYSLSLYIENSPTVHSAPPFGAVLQRHLRLSNVSSSARLSLSSAVQWELKTARAKVSIAGQSMVMLPKRGRLQRQLHLGSRLKHMMMILANRSRYSASSHARVVGLKHFWTWKCVAHRCWDPPG